jgi:glycosyltransferase involved in cell wall biosynthesis
MIDRVAIVVPAADEQHHIARCLHSIDRAREHLLRRYPDIKQVEIVVVLDDCRDDTRAVVARFPRVKTLTSVARCVGATRGRGASHAIGSLPQTMRLWIANTDADSEVPRNWLTHMVAEANLGAHLTLGTVLPGAGLSRAVRAAWLARHDSLQGHSHIHGANLGIRADTYLDLGGWRPLRVNEDIDLVGRATARNELKIVRTASIPVMTSARLVGRAPEGFSSYLRHLHESVGA